MSEQTNQEIDYYELVQRRKNIYLVEKFLEMEEEEEEELETELQEIDAQIKKAEWLLMRAMFRMQECFALSLFEGEIRDTGIFRHLLSFFFLEPSPQKFKNINHILNLNNVIEIQNAFIEELLKTTKYNYICGFFWIIHNCGKTTSWSGFQKKLSKIIIQSMPQSMEIAEGLISNEQLLTVLNSHYRTFIEQKKEIDYTNNYIPQKRQGSYYFSRKVKPCELERDFCVDNLSLKPDSDFEDTYSLFDYCTTNWKNITVEEEEITEQEKDHYVSNTVAYLESRYATCHFDGSFFKNNKQPSEQTRKFYMHIWRNSSKLLQNVARYRLNTNSEIYTAAQEKFRSEEFQKYILEYPDQTNDLLFAFSFLPNEFAQSQKYDELMQQAQSSKYYSSITLIDKLIHQSEFHISISSIDNEEIIFSALVNFIISIDPTKEINKIDDILLNNKLLVEISFKYINESSEGYIFNAINNLNRYPDFAANNLIPYHTKILCLATTICIEDNNNIDVPPETFIDDPFLFKLLSEVDNHLILRYAYFMSKRIDILKLSELKNRITYDDFEFLYINDIKLYDLGNQKLALFLNEFSRSSLTLKELAERNLGDRKEQKLFVKPCNYIIEKNQKDLTLATKPIYLLISNATPKDQIIPENLLSTLESLKQKDLKSLADILRNFSNELTNLCSRICQAENPQEHISNLKSLFDKEGLLKNYSNIQKQTFCAFVWQNSRNTKEFLKLNYQKKREFILMCSLVKKNYFKKDLLLIISTEHMSILYRYFQAVQTLDMPNNTKYEMIMNIRYLFFTTDCRKIDTDIFTTLIFKNGAIDLLVKDKKARDSFIESPDEFLSNYKNMFNQEQQNNFHNKIYLSKLATQFAQNSSNLNAFLPSLNSNEKNQFAKYYILAGGDINSLPEEIRNLDITKQLLNVRKSQEKYVSHSIDVER